MMQSFSPSGADHESARSRPEVPQSALRINLLGPVEVRTGHESRPIGGTTPQAVLALLALGAGKVVTVDRMVEEVWPDDTPSSARATISSHVSRLRAAVSPATIARQGAGYLLDVDADVVDAHRFVAAVDRAAALLRDGRPADAVRATSTAIGMWRGLPLSGLEGYRFADRARARLLRRRTDALVLRGEGLLAADRVTEAIHHLETVAAAAPEREQVWALLARSLYRSGRQQEALDVVREAVTSLRDDFGLEPSPALTDLELAILQHDPDLSAHRPRTADGLGLPTSASALFGRDDDLEVLLPRLRAGTGVVLTLVGAPGVGKTRLAAELAHRAPRPAEVHWVDVRAAGRDAGGLIALLVRVAEAPFSATRTGAEVLASVLRERRSLVVLDAAEHQPDSVSELVDLVVAEAPHTAIVVTSRHEFALPGAVVHVVRPLPTDGPGGGPGPAVQLYRERAARTAGVPIEQVGLDHARAVCSAMDGLPLAIEVASGLLRTFGTDDLADRLQRDLDLVVAPGGPEDRLRLALDDSTALLEEDTRSVLAVAAAFSGTFSLGDLGDLTAIASEGLGDVAGHLHALVTRSLLEVVVVSGGERRYRLLDVVRAHMRASLDGPGAQALAASHATWARQVAHEVGAHCAGRRQAEVLEEMDRLLPELDAAVGWSLAHQPDTAVAIVGHLAAPMFIRSRLETQRRWVEAVRGAVRTPTQDSGFWLAVTFMHYMRGELPDAMVAGTRSVELAEEDGQRSLSLFWNGALHAMGGEGQAAARAIDEAERLAGARGDLPVQSYAATTRAWMAFFAGQVDEAITLSEQARALADASGDEWGVSYQRYMHGIATLVAGRLEEARDHHREALRAALRVGHVTGGLDLLATNALWATSQGRWAEGSRLHGAIDALLDATGTVRTMFPAVTMLDDAMEGRRDDAAYRAGRRMSFREAAERALSL